MKRLRTLLPGLVVAAAIVTVGTATHVAGARCWPAYTKQEGKGGVSGSVTARHLMRSDHCRTASNVSDRGISLHYAEEVGWTSWLMDVGPDGKSIDKIGTKNRAVGDALWGGDAGAEPARSLGGGEIIDGGTFSHGAPQHLDPALALDLNAYQVIRLMYDGLTETDATDPANVHVVPHQAESYETNEHATVWTFRIRDGLTFADGEPILPSTYARSWDRVAELGGFYSYLINFIDGGAERLAGEAEDISGVVADDRTMTLTVTLDEPYANFDALAGFQVFRPVPEAAFSSGEEYDHQLMVGSGAYTLEQARDDQIVVLLKNDTWAGDFNGDTWPARAERIVFQISADVQTSFTALQAGEVMSASIPPGHVKEVRRDWGNSLDVPILASYHFAFNGRDPRVGGDSNRLLRQAISQAIDRDAINDGVFEGTRLDSTGITPPGVPGFKPDVCEFCTYDPEAAQAAFDSWAASGNELDGALPIQFARGGGNEDVVEIVIENLSAIGIDAKPDPMDSETYFATLAEGACVFCRVSWLADYPAYDNFLFDPFSTASLGRNNYGYSNPEFDTLVARGKSTTDASVRNRLFREAEAMLLNDDVMAVPINWYVGQLAWDEDRLDGFSQDVLGLVHYERVTVVS